MRSRSQQKCIKLLKRTADSSRELLLPLAKGTRSLRISRNKLFL